MMPSFLAMLTVSMAYFGGIHGAPPFPPGARCNTPNDCPAPNYPAGTYCVKVMGPEAVELGAVCYCPFTHARNSAADGCDLLEATAGPNEPCDPYSDLANERCQNQGTDVMICRKKKCVCKDRKTKWMNSKCDKLVAPTTTDIPLSLLSGGGDRPIHSFIPLTLVPLVIIYSALC